MKTIPIHDAKSNLSKYISAAKKGEKIYIGSFGKPEVILMNIPNLINPKTRDPSLLKGKIKEKKNSFTKNTDKEVVDLMYGE